MPPTVCESGTGMKCRKDSLWCRRCWGHGFRSGRRHAERQNGPDHLIAVCDTKPVLDTLVICEELVRAGQHYQTLTSHEPNNDSTS